MGYIVLLLYRQKHEAAEIIRCGRTLRKIAVIGVVGLMLLFCGDDLGEYNRSDAEMVRGFQYGPVSFI